MKLNELLAHKYLGAKVVVKLFNMDNLKSVAVFNGYETTIDDMLNNEYELLIEVYGLHEVINFSAAIDSNRIPYISILIQP